MILVFSPFLEQKWQNYIKNKSFHLKKKLYLWIFSMTKSLLSEPPAHLQNSLHYDGALGSWIQAKNLVYERPSTVTCARQEKLFSSIVPSLRLCSSEGQSSIGERKDPRLAMRLLEEGLHTANIYFPETVRNKPLQFMVEVTTENIWSWYSEWWIIAKIIVLPTAACD